MKFELKGLTNVAEVATVGGMVKQYQVVVDPLKLAGYGITHQKVINALRAANQETGGAVVQMAKAEYMVRASGYLAPFFSVIAITLAFLPVFTLQAQEGRLFGPHAFMKTYAMAGAAGLAVTLVPVLMGYWIRGCIPEKNANPVNRVLIAAYRPLQNRRQRPR